MNKKIVVLGGGNGLSTFIKGLKLFPVDITAIVSVCDDGSSTGKLREEFNIPAVGDIRRVLTSLATTEPLIEQLLNYRFSTSSDLNGHTVGNLLLTALTNITGNLSDGIESLGKVLNLKGKVVPLTEDNVILMGEMTDGNIIKGEHNITNYNSKIKKVFYEEEPVITDAAIKAIKEADLIILSIGSMYTSIIPNLICKGIIKEIDNSNAKIMCICNLMTQPGETDGFTTSDHISLLNSYLGKRKIDVAVVNNKSISKKILKKYETMEQKDQVFYDKDNLKKLNINIIADDFVAIQNGVIRHDVDKLSLAIFTYLMKR